MYCRSVLTLTVSLECLSLSSSSTSRNVKREVTTRSTNDNVTRSQIGDVCRRAGPGGTIPRARVTVRPRGVSVSAHILSTKTPTHHRAHILAGANCKRWPAHMDMHNGTQHPCMQQSVHAQFAMPNKPTEGLGSRARLCFATPHARPQQPTRILVLSDAMNGGHMPY